MCATIFSNCPIELKNCYTENTNPGKEVCFDVFLASRLIQILSNVSWLEQVQKHAYVINEWSPS